MPGYGYNTIGSGISSAGDDIAAGITRAWQEHERAKRAEGQFDAITRIVRDDSGNIYPDAGMVPKDVKAKPIFDSSFVDGVKQSLGKDKAYRAGTLDAWSRIIGQSIARKQASDVEDASISGQRAAQAMQNEAQMAPLQRQHIEAEINHLNALGDEPSMDVPGMGKMTLPAASAHMARVARLQIAQTKNTPALNFQNQMLTQYGQTVPGIVAATKQQFPSLNPQGKPVDENGNVVDDISKAKQFKGVPFVTPGGARVTVDKGQFIGADNQPIKYDPANPTVYAQMPNGAQVPAHLWPTIASKAQTFTDQATKIQAFLKTKSPDQLTDQDQAAARWANSILGVQGQ